MTDCIFTSYCFGDDYLNQQVRLKESILKIYPDANLHFQNESIEVGKFKFQQSLYGFKVRLVKECLAKGFTKIIFLDTAMTLQGEVDYYFDLIKDYGVMAVADNSTLYEVTSDSVLDYLRLQREQIRNWKLLGGSVYVFDFDLPKCNEIFNSWSDLEEHGLFGQQDDLSNGRLQGHRMDETCMSLAMHLNGVKPLNYEQMRYAYMHPQTLEIKRSDTYTPIFLKKHFK
jgi:hypothetical protein